MLKNDSMATANTKQGNTMKDSALTGQEIENNSAGFFARHRFVTESNPQALIVGIYNKNGRTFAQLRYIGPYGGALGIQRTEDVTNQSFTVTHEKAYSKGCGLDDCPID